MKYIKCVHVMAFSFGSGLTLFAVQAQTNQIVAVKLVVSTQNGLYKYSYAVTNQSNKRIKALVVGIDVSNENSELTSALPLQSGSDDKVDPVYSGAPKGWTTPRIRNVQGDVSNSFSVAWVENSGLNLISPGGSLSGFMVEAASLDPACMNLHFSVTFADRDTFDGVVQVVSSPTSH